MKILHYSLGFPPFRTGGLTKFCTDLMVQQAREGNEVSLIWPGEIGILNKTTSIKNSGVKIINESRICSYRIKNPLPIPYDEGIGNVEPFVNEGDEGVYLRFLEEIKPDVLHIHTFMGLHKNFLTAAKKLNIHIVFSAHDFFPICPKVTLFKNGGICENANNCDECSVCNASALSMKKMIILQSRIYRILKDTAIVKKLRKQHRDAYLADEDCKISEINFSDYFQLKRYYQMMMNLIDVIHYNSTLTKEIYEKYLGKRKSKVISISHGDISDNRRLKEVKDDCINVRYLGAQSRAKGYFYLKKSINNLKGNKNKLVLHIHFQPEKSEKYMRVHHRYTYSELEQIFENTDVLIMPSICYETYGYVVLEALSYGVPVIISNNVGAKDIIVENAGIVFDSKNQYALTHVLEQINADMLMEMNRVICEKQPIITMEKMARQIEKDCYGWTIA